MDSTRRVSSEKSLRGNLPHLSDWAREKWSQRADDSARNSGWRKNGNLLTADLTPGFLVQALTLTLTLTSATTPLPPHHCHHCVWHWIVIVPCSQGAATPTYVPELSRQVMVELKVEVLWGRAVVAYRRQRVRK